MAPPCHGPGGARWLRARGDHAKLESVTQLQDLVDERVVRDRGVRFLGARMRA